MIHHSYSKRLFSWLLAALLVCSVIVFQAFAVEDSAGAEPPAALTPEVIPNQLLRAVDFRGDADFAPGMLANKGGSAAVSEDGKAVTLTVAKVDRLVHSLYWGGLVGDLELDASHSYTITFAMTNTGDYQFGVKFDYDGSTPANSNGFQGTPDTLDGVTVGEADEADGTRYYCVEIDGANSCFNLYVLTDGVYRMITAKEVPETLGDRLALLFYLYGGRNTTAPTGEVLAEITVSDVNIYSGIYRGAMLHNQSPAADGTLLLEIPDLSRDAFNPLTGIGYRHTVGEGDDFYRYDETTGTMKTYAKGVAGTVTYGGTTNLKLDQNSKYTVSYLTTSSTSSGSGLRVSYKQNSRSVGSYIQASQACLAWGTNTTNGYSGYKKYTSGMYQSGSIFCNDGYAKIDIEVNGTVISIYVNDFLLLREDITAPSNSTANESITKNFMSDTLSMVLHEYHLATVAEGALSTTFKDVKIYAGLLHQEVYDVEALQLQVGAPVGGAVAIRFVGGGISGSYNRVGFEITAAYGGQSDNYEYSTPETYLKLLSPKADAGIAELLAEGSGWSYLYGYTLSGVPADITVTFTVRPFAMRNGNRMYGEAVTFVLENGILK